LRGSAASWERGISVTTIGGENYKEDRMAALAECAATQLLLRQGHGKTAGNFWKELGEMLAVAERDGRIDNNLI